MSKSKIEWTEETWNVTTGCTRVSKGCDNCYAVAMTKRLAGIEATKDKYSGLVNENKNHFNGWIRLHEDELEKPFKWKKPRKVFVNSMSDLFHPRVSFEFIDKVFALMALAKIHTFQVLTKRPERMVEYFNRFRTIEEMKNAWGYAYTYWRSTKMTKATMNPDDIWDHLKHTEYPLPNVWLGTSVEDQQAADERIPYLLECPAAVRFLSCEPLLGGIDLLYFCNKEKTTDDRGWPVFKIKGCIDWVIVGGESGHNARPMHPDWVRSLRDQCKKAGVSFFFKQWGAWQNGSDKDAKEDRIVLNTGVVNEVGEINVNELPAHRSDQWYAANPVRMSKVGKKYAGRSIDGRQWNEMPEIK